MKIEAGRDGGPAPEFAPGTGGEEPYVPALSLPDGIIQNSMAG